MDRADRIGVVEVRDRLADALNRVAYGGERIVLERRGKGVAVLVSMDDLAALEAIEDELDLAAARQAKAEGGRPVPLEKVAERLGVNLSPAPSAKPRGASRKRREA